MALYRRLRGQSGLKLFCWSHTLCCTRCEKCMKCKCQSVHDQGKVGNISPVWAKCALDHFHLYNRPDAVLGHAGFLSAPLTHLLSSTVNFDLRKRLLLLLMWVRPSSCRWMLGLFLCRLVMMESFIQSF